MANMAQTMVAEQLRQYHILAPDNTNMIDFNEELLQDLEIIPQGIAALYEYSERFARDHGRAKKLVNAFLNLTGRHRGRLLDVRFLPLMCVLAYLSRPMISSVLSSVLERTGRFPQGTVPRPRHSSYVTKATQTCAPDFDPSATSDSAQGTVTFTVAEMLWMKSITTDLLGNQEKSKIRQADMLTAIGDKEDENESLRDEVTRLEMKIQDLEKQQALDQNNQRRLYNERETYRLGGKDFKEKWETLQKEYNNLEDDRDEHREMFEKLRDDLEDMTVQRDELQKANELLEIENEDLETNAATDKDAATEYEETCEDLDKHVSRQVRELEAAAKEIADLKAQLAAVSVVNWEGLDDSESGLGAEEPKELESAVQATGSQVGLKEDTSKPISQPMTVEQSKVEIRKLKKELDELKAVHKIPEPSPDTWRGAVFEQPKGFSDNNVEEGAPLRRIQSAPLWLPRPHHGDAFDPLSDVSDNGDGHEQDENDGDEDDHDSGDNNGSRSDQHDNHDDNGDDEDDGRDGGAEKVAIDAHQTRQDRVRDTTPLPKDISLPDTPPNDEQIPVVPEPSPRRVSPKLNVAAPAFVPSHHPTRPVPFRAMGPEDTKNPHVKEINQGLKRRTWIEKSGKPDFVEGQEGVAVAEEVIDDMYDRQVLQYLNFNPIDCARGSMWGALNDVSNRLDDVSTPAKNDDDAHEASPEIQQSLDAHSSGSQEGNEEHDEDEGEWSDVEDEGHEKTNAVMPMLGRYQVTRGQKDDQKDDATPMLGNYKVTRGSKPINNSSKESQKKPTVDTQKTKRKITPVHCESGAPKDEEESEAAGDWTDVEDGTDEDVQDEDSPEENGGMPMLGKYKVTRDDTPSDSDHETSEVENESGHDSSPPLACGTNAQEMSRQDVTTPVAVPQSAGPSTSDPDTTNQLCDAAVSQAPPQSPSSPTILPNPQPPPGAPTGPRAHTPRNPSPKSSDSALPTSPQPKNPDTTPRVLLPTPRRCGIDNQDLTPRVRLPQQPMRNQTQPAPVTPSTRPSMQEEQDSNTNSEQAIIFRQPPRTSEPQSTPVNPGSPRNVSAAPPSRRENSSTQNGNRAPPTGPAAGVPHWSPHGNARGTRGGRGGYRNPAQDVPVKGSIPRGPAAANTTPNNNSTPSRQSGRGHGSGSAASSFQRFQERMAREKGSE